jgi:hypothetical protein
MLLLGWSRGTLVFTPALIIPLMPLIAVLLFEWGIYSGAKRSAEAVKGKIQYSFSRQGFAAFSPVAQSRNDWESLSKVEEKKKDFLFYPQENVFFIIPKNSFQDAEQTARFRRILQETLGEKARLKK